LISPARGARFAGLDEVIELFERFAAGFAADPSRLVRYGYINGLRGFVTAEAGEILQTTALFMRRATPIYGGHAALTERFMRARAEATITVQHSEAEAYDETESPALLELRISETFTGDIEGESPVRALQVQRSDKSSSLVSVQRFRGKLAGRQGGFVLQGSEIIENSKITGTWLVVPGSGTDELRGLRGEGGFEGRFGKGSHGTLDYWFE
jgi:hypothetical protein